MSNDELNKVEDALQKIGEVIKKHATAELKELYLLDRILYIDLEPATQTNSESFIGLPPITLEFDEDTGDFLVISDEGVYTEPIESIEYGDNHMPEEITQISVELTEKITKLLSIPENTNLLQKMDQMGFAMSTIIIRNSEDRKTSLMITEEDEIFLKTLRIKID